MTRTSSRTRGFRRSVTKSADLSAIRAVAAPTGRLALLSSTSLVAGLFAGLGGMVAMTAPAYADCAVTINGIECVGTDADGYTNTALPAGTTHVIVHDGGTVNTTLYLGNTTNQNVDVVVDLQAEDTLPPAAVNGTGAGNHGLHVITNNGTGTGSVTVNAGEGTSITGGSTGNATDALRVRSGGAITFNLDGNISAGNGTNGEIIDAQSSAGGAIVVNLNKGTYTAYQSDGIVLGTSGGAGPATVSVIAKDGVVLTGGNSSDDYSLWILNSLEADIDFDAKITDNDGNGIHVGVGSGGGSATDVDILLRENAEIVVGSVGVYVDATGDVEITNYGTVGGGTFGIEVTNADTVLIRNHSYNSVIGLDSGEYVHDVGSVAIGNSGGFVIGLGDEGILIEGISGFWSDGLAMPASASVVIMNAGRIIDDVTYGGGIVVGNWDGIQIHEVDQGSVVINNSGWVLGDTQLSGGLIAGVRGDGIDISYVDDNVVIRNANTRAAFSGIDLAEVFDPDTLEDLISWLPAGYLDAQNLLPGGYTTGIWGYDDGIVIDEVGDLVYIDNGAGLIVGVDGNGIAASYVDGRGVSDADLFGGETRVGFALYNGATNESDLGGIVWGGDDAIDLYDIDGSVLIENGNGAIFGVDQGININDVWRGNVIISNAAGGVIQGLTGDAIDIYDVSRGAGYGGHVEISNRGQIVAGDSAIVIEYARSAQILNLTGDDGQPGLIIGDGGWGEWVIDLYDVNIPNNAGMASADILNQGIIASRALPHFTYGSSGWSIDPDEVAQVPESTFDLDALEEDILGFATHISSPGGTLDTDALAAYADAANDRAIRSDEGGATRVENDGGLLVGRVSLDGRDGSVGNFLLNDGIWFVTGSNTLNGGPNDAIENQAWIQTAFEHDDNENTSFEANSFLNSGLVSMVDGGTGDRTTIRGDYTGDGGAVFFDLDLSDTTADLLRLRNGTIEGETGLVFRLIGTGGGAYGDEIDVVDYRYDDTEETAFFIDALSDNYIEIGDLPMIEDGFLGWHLVQDTDREEFELVAGWGPGAINAPSILTGAQNIWYETFDVVKDHVYGGQFASAGGGGADLSPPVVVPGAPAPAPQTASVWLKGSGSLFDSDTEYTDTATSITYDTSFEQKTASVLAGVDFQPSGDLRMGLFGGYVLSGVEFALPGTSLDYSGGVIGGYAAYNNGAFYADVTAKVDLLGATYHFAGIDADTSVTSYGVAANTGYRFGAGAAFFEPIASIAYVLTSAEDISDGNGTVSFDDATSLRVGAGVRVGTSVATGDFVTEVSLLGRVWNEFAGENAVTVNYGSDSYTINNATGGVFGELAATATIQSADGGLSGFVSAGGKFGESFSSYGAEVGFRVGF